MAIERIGRKVNCSQIHHTGICRVSCVCLLLSWFLYLSGCERVSNDWKLVSAQTVTVPRLIGLVSEEHESGTSQTIVVEYSIFPYNHTWGPDLSKVYVSIPLNKGEAPYPLRFDGKITSMTFLSIPPKQAQDLASFRFSRDSMERAGALVRSNKVPAPNTPGSCYSSGSMGQLASPARDIGNCSYLAPYWFSDPILDKSDVNRSYGDTLNSFCFYQLYANPSPLTPPDGVLLLPFDQPRPREDVDKARHWAIAKTPVDFCIDAVMTPLDFLVFGFYRMVGITF